MCRQSCDAWENASDHHITISHRYVALKNTSAFPMVMLFVPMCAASQSRSLVASALVRFQRKQPEATVSVTSAAPRHTRATYVVSAT